ncbi:WD40-repeat-containing domain protein [Elsinoe ampelina]|uniref:WD40-repeat-containing domain protein n=1 Tax=Elsinoe ampelina TaxID=302913 RepID=A0A6A6G4V0_9PEZI|nr:WD40-repeat-containing domain protein [Elsinoe ampelina]
MRLEGQTTSPHNNGTVSNGSRSSNGTPHKGGHTNGSSTNGESNGHAAVAVRPTGDFHGHDREEVTRILIQSLTDLGYHGAAGMLSRESGFELENTSVAAFRLAVQEGEWNEAEGLLFGRRPESDGGVVLKGNGHTGDDLSWLRRGGAVGDGHLPVLPLAEGADQEEMLFLIRQQKYLELLEQRDLATALSVLRREITPLHRDTARLHTLTSLMMCPTADELRQLAKWDGAHGDSRNNLLSDLSSSIAPSVMIPEHRLAVLFKHVQDNQIFDCLYHNTTSVPSLYHDHVCDRDDFPLEQLTELRDHHDEVWFIAFSPKGTYLATASADSHVYIYNTTSWRIVHRLNETHTNGEVSGIVSISWSPDEKYLLSCSRGNQLTVYDIQDSGRRVSTYTSYTYPVTAAAWLPDGQHFVVGSQDIERALVQYRLGDLSPMHEYTTREQKTRIHDLAVSANGARMVSIANDKRIMTWDLSKSGRTLLSDTTMDDVPQSVSVSADGKQMLVGMKGHKLYLMDTDTGEFVQSYSGQVTDQYVIRARFGGAGEGFVISGSEDSRVVIWRKESAVQVVSLDCHAPGPVNAVAWHPKNYQIFATAGDDRRVKM